MKGRRKEEGGRRRNYRRSGTRAGGSILGDSVERWNV